MSRTQGRLGIFRSELGITLTFGEETFFISAGEPFHNIGVKSLENDDFIPFYVEIARRKNLGPEFVDSLRRRIEEHTEKESD